jgi:alpha-glucosidase (family GH31 glycosyl hydrolase)
MMPLWAHGLLASSPAYQDSTLAIQAVKGFRENKMHVSGLVLPIDYENKYFDSNAKTSLISSIR